MNPHPTTFSPVGTVREPPVIRQKTAAPFRHSGESRNPSLIPPSCHLEAPRGTPYWGALHRSKIPPTRQAAPLPYRSFPRRACPREYGCGNPSPPHPLSSRMRGPILSPLPAPTCHSERSEAESRNLVFLRATPVPPLVFLIILPSTFSPYQHSYPPLPSFSFIPHMRKTHQPRCAQSLA